jgi:TATA-box binding protein (TBP) (component of TFIID and TFIIIB)
VFPNGKVIGMGSKKKEDAEQGFKRLINFIGKALNMRVHMIEFKITNIVANAHLGYKVNLDRLCQ